MLLPCHRSSPGFLLAEGLHPDQSLFLVVDHSLIHGPQAIEWPLVSPGQSPRRQESWVAS
jgi:hypothetical protein